MPEGTSRELRGKFDYKIDPKNRISTPVDWRPDEGDSLWLMEASRQGKPTVKVLTGRQLDSMVEIVKTKPNVAQQLKDAYIRQLNSKCVPVTINPQGKLLIPKRMCEDAMLDTDVKLVGCGDYFEIWNPWVFEEVERLEILDIKGLNEELGFF